MSGYGPKFFVFDLYIRRFIRSPTLGYLYNSRGTIIRKANTRKRKIFPLPGFEPGFQYLIELTVFNYCQFQKTLPNIRDEPSKEYHFTSFLVQSITVEVHLSRKTLNWSAALPALLTWMWDRELFFNLWSALHGSGVVLWFVSLFLFSGFIKWNSFVFLFLAL